MERPKLYCFNISRHLTLTLLLSLSLSLSTSLPFTPPGLSARAQDISDRAAQPDASLSNGEDNLGWEHCPHWVLLRRRCAWQRARSRRACVSSCVCTKARRFVSMTNRCTITECVVHTQRLMHAKHMHAHAHARTHERVISCCKGT